MKKIILFLFVLLTHNYTYAQDTFSIVAVDKETGEIGAAGATCIKGIEQGIIKVISSIVPGKGGIISQAYVCIPNKNLQNATTKMKEGMSPSEIIDWLIENDDCQYGTELSRQYGIVDFDDNGNVRTAGFTGSEANDYKEDRQGVNYSIQGNILLNKSVIDKMEQNFLNTNGSLAEKLMAAMQGANFPGADNRCLDDGTSSTTGFLVLYKKDDAIDNPSIKINIGAQPSGVEPIDIIQKKLNEVI